MDIPGKVTIITGASMGIGAATAREFAQAGAAVVLVSRSSEKLSALANELNHNGREALALPADVRDLAAVQQMVEQAVQHYGRVDILINNAGQSALGKIAEINPEYVREIIDLNIFGVLNGIQAVVPQMRQTGGGLIINISSMTSKLRLPGLGAYAATKAAVNLLSDTARVELAPDNIRVITVFPRTTETDFRKNALRDPQMVPQARAPGLTGAPVVDSAEYVAKRILLAAQTEPEEMYMDGGKQ